MTSLSTSHDGGGNTMLEFRRRDVIVSVNDFNRVSAVIFAIGNRLATDFWGGSMVDEAVEGKEASWTVVVHSYVTY